MPLQQNLPEPARTRTPRLVLALGARRSPPEPAEFWSGAREFLPTSLTQFACFRTLESPEPPRNPPEPAAEPAKKCSGASAIHDFGLKEKTRNPPEPAPEPAVFGRCPTPFDRFMVSHRDFIILLLKSGVKPYFVAWGLAGAWPGACRADPWISRILTGGWGSSPRSVVRPYTARTTPLHVVPCRCPTRRNPLELARTHRDLPECAGTRRHPLEPAGTRRNPPEPACTCPPSARWPTPSPACPPRPPTRPPRLPARPPHPPCAPSSERLLAHPPACPLHPCLCPSEPTGIHQNPPEPAGTAPAALHPCSRSPAPLARQPARPHGPSPRL